MALNVGLGGKSSRGGGGGGNVDGKINAHNVSPDAHQGIRDELANKVEKVVGKGLSANDLTDELLLLLQKALQAADLMGFVKNPTWNGAQYVLTLPVEGGQALVVDLPVEALLKDLRYDEETNELILVTDMGDRPVLLNKLVVGLASEAYVNQMFIDFADTLSRVAFTGSHGDLSGRDAEGAHDLATDTKAGFMSKEDKAKLGDIPDSTQLDALLENKVDKREGYGLVADKYQLGINSGRIQILPLVATAHDNEMFISYNIFNPGTNDHTARSVRIPRATQAAAGVMSKSDKIKLDDLQETMNWSIMIHNERNTSHQDIRDQLDVVNAKAEGGQKAYVFDDLADMNAHLADPDFVALLQPGNKLLIKAAGVADYWWTGDEALEAESKMQIDWENVTVTFVEYATRENISSGEKLSTIAGKIRKWFSDLGALAFKDKVDYETDIDNLPISSAPTLDEVLSVGNMSSTPIIIAASPNAGWRYELSYNGLRGRNLGPDNTTLGSFNLDVDQGEMFAAFGSNPAFGIRDRELWVRGRKIYDENTGFKVGAGYGVLDATPNTLGNTEQGIMRNKLETVVTSIQGGIIPKTTSLLKLAYLNGGIVDMKFDGAPQPQCTAIYINESATVDLTVTLPTAIPGAANIYKFDGDSFVIPPGKCAEVNVLTIAGDVFIHFKISL